MPVTQSTDIDTEAVLKGVMLLIRRYNLLTDRFHTSRSKNGRDSESPHEESIGSIALPTQTARQL